MNFRIEPFEVSASVSAGFPGATILTIPPIGSISAATHNQPLRLHILLQNIDLDNLRSIVNTADIEDQEALVEYFSRNVQAVILAFALRLLGIAGLGGILGVLMLTKRTWRSLVVGFLIGSLLIGIIIGSTILTFDIQAFQHPHYQGIIEAAPWMIGLIQESLVQVEVLGEQIQVLASNLYNVFNQIEDLSQVGVFDIDLTVLHVSDIHNHPVAYDFISQVTNNFNVDLIIDTGDLTDWGTPLEAEIVKQIEQLNVNYVFIPGNHEAPDVIQRLLETENVIVINDSSHTIMGLTIAGIPDPAADSYAPQTLSSDELSTIAQDINRKYLEQEEVPDIFAVHNHRIATQIEPGIFPVVLYGHSHIQSVNIVDNTVYVNAGTTGAAGVRGLMTKEPVPFTLSMLYFRYEPFISKYQLTAVDSIEISGLEASFSLDRTFILTNGRNRVDNVEDLNDILD